MTGKKFVDHPRYGDQPIRSGENWTEAEVRAAYWGYNRTAYTRDVLFPETAIRADWTKQYAGWGWRRAYVDIARPCRTCRRWFLFFALEQKYWYETLGFFIDADCVHCQECRHEQHVQDRQVQLYEALLAKPGKTRSEWLELSRLGDALFEIGYIKKAETLQRTRLPRRLRAGLGR
ncbi:MAG: zinc-ribbon domain containing protein [Pseudomonadota bacterium]